MHRFNADLSQERKYIYDVSISVVAQRGDNQVVRVVPDDKRISSDATFKCLKIERMRQTV